MAAANAVNGERPRYAPNRESALRQIRPWHRYSHHLRLLRARIGSLAGDLGVPHEGRVLDYGAGDSPYRHLFPPTVEYVGADLPGNAEATVVLGEHGRLPTPDGTFDAVISTQVLEHVTDPGLYLSEAFRVLSPGGRLLLSTHGTFVWHPDPSDYWRWTWEGLQRAVREAGFELEHFEGIVGPLPAALQLVLDAIYWRLPGTLRPPVTLVFETLIRVTDRLHGKQARDRNAQVFALVARRP